MVLDLIVTGSDDGYTAEVPTVKGCESWAHTDDEAIDKTIELLVYYLKLKSRKDIKIDLARRMKNKFIYKLVFEK